MEEYQIIQPSKLLAPYVKQYWFLKVADFTQTSQRVIPNGSVSLFFHRGNRMFSLSTNEIQPNAFISGQSTGYSDLQQTGSVDMVAVIFQPHGAKAFFTVPVSKLFESAVSVEDLGDSALSELQDRIMDTNEAFSCARLIENFLMQRLNVAKAYNHRRMEAVVQAINSGQMNIESLAGISCLSYKHFKRIFAEYVGVNPKGFLRVVRFQKALFLLQNSPKMSLAQLAFECGYYDQPHLVKEFRALSGYSPSEYISICSPYSDYFA